jgi:hypothetical protein
LAARLTAEFILAIDTRPLYPFRTVDQRSIQAEPNVKPPTLDTGKPIVQDYPRGSHTPVSDRLEGAAFLTHQKQLDGQSSTTRHKRKRSEGQLPHTLLNAKARRGRTSSVSDTDSSSTCHPAPIRSGASWTTSSSSDPGYTASLYPEAIRATQSASSGFALSLPGPPSLRDSSARLLAPVESSNKQEEASSSDVLVVFGEDMPKDLPESHLLFLEEVCRVNTRLYGQPRLEISKDTTEPSYSETRKAVIVTNLFSTLARVEYKAEL